jgi:hypothetical protein
MMPAEPGEKTDHPHQKSAWFCHGDVIPRGIELKQKVKGVEGVDFWSEAPGHGRIVCVGVEAKQEKNHGWAATRNEWRTADGAKVLDEARTVHVYNLGDGQLIVLDIDLFASACPVTFGDTKEGSFGVRVRQSVTVQGGGRLVNAQGKVGEGANNNRNRDGCWGLISDWCDYSGKVGNGVAGVALFADPKNPYPSCWHARNYGLLAANPFGREKSGFPDMKGKTTLVTLDKGEHLKLRYGMYLHSGDEKAGKVAEAFQEFVRLRQ